MNTPAWLNRKKKTPSHVISLINNARVNGCWIFHEKSQKFYTPDEFEKDWERAYHSANKYNNFKEFKIVNPLYAVRLCARWLDIANQRNQEILKKLEEYSGEFKKKA
ncbi:hypothetical protein ACFRAE_08690 [Sphingobacterium sp. HJSM2_6]|uniref:hypothetical protein n=1 Tax=Sphingobacterium sp. HJSM2_6 TaxID=3366264 RepID=UPI003BEB47A3